MSLPWRDEVGVCLSPNRLVLVRLARGLRPRVVHETSHSFAEGANADWRPAVAALAGLVLVSCAMDLQILFFSARNDLPYATFLPAFANVAQFHGRLKGALGASPEAARRAAEAFVAEDYLRALHLGGKLGGSERRRAMWIVCGINENRWAAADNLEPGR